MVHAAYIRFLNASQTINTGTDVQIALEFIQQDQEPLSRSSGLILLNAIYTPSHLVFLRDALSKLLGKVQINSLKKRQSLAVGKFDTGWHCHRGYPRYAHGYSLLLAYLIFTD